MKNKIYHVTGIHRSDVLYGTFSTLEKALKYKDKLEKSPTADYVYRFEVEEAELDPDF